MVPNEVSYTVVSISVFERFCVDDKPIKKSVRKHSGVDTGVDKWKQTENPIENILVRFHWYKNGYFEKRMSGVGRLRKLFRRRLSLMKCKTNGDKN